MAPVPPVSWTLVVPHDALPNQLKAWDDCKRATLHVAPNPTTDGALRLSRHRTMRKNLLVPVNR